MSPAAVPPTRIGIVRALVGGYTLAYLAARRSMFRQVARSEPDLFAPVGPVRALRRPLSPPVADALGDATLATTVLFALGAGHRVTAPLHTALLTWTLAYRNSWSMIFHSDNVLVLHTLALSIGRAADAVSVDAVVAGCTPAPHPRYEWPLRLMNASSAATYLVAGVAKVAGESGWSWARGDQLRRQVAIDGLRKEVFGSHASPVAYAAYRYRPLFTAMAVGSLAVELGAPLALANRRLGKLWALTTIGLHWGILGMMGIRFRYQLSGVAFASWFDVECAAGRRILKSATAVTGLAPAAATTAAGTTAAGPAAGRPRAATRRPRR